jgi:hypothetical protein
MWGYFFAVVLQFVEKPDISLTTNPFFHIELPFFCSFTISLSHLDIATYNAVGRLICCPGR